MGTYQPFYDLPAAQFQALVNDVAARGVLLPIIVDEAGRVIDGHQRRRAAAEVGVECPKVVVAGLTEDEKQTLALTLNLFRRHLSGTERSRALQQLANLGLSTRRMADILGVSKSTVHNDLRQLSNSGQLSDRPDRVRGADGKSRPATMPERPPVDVDPETGEIVSGGAGDREEPVADVGPASPPGTSSSGGGSPAAPVPSNGDSPSVLPVETPGHADAGYRERASRVHASTRSSLLALDPERVALVVDPGDRGAWLALAGDLTAWAASLTAALDESAQLRRIK